MPVTLAGLLEELRVPRRGVLYLHSSMDRMWRVGLGLDEVLATLMSWAGDRGTLVLPTFPFVVVREKVVLRVGQLRQAGLVGVRGRLRARPERDKKEA